MEDTTCRSGLKGWRAYLRENYGSAEVWKSCAEIYSLAERLGYPNTEEGISQAWADNPLIEGSVDPSDFRVVEEKE